MRNIITLVLVFLFFNSTMAQFNDANYTIKLLSAKYRQNYAATRDLDNYLRENLSSTFNIGKHSNIQLKPVVNIGKAHLIEGMDIKAAGSPQLEFIVQELSTKQKDTFIYSKELTAKNKAQMGSQLISLFIKDAKAMGDLEQFIIDFINQSLSDGCVKQFEKIDLLSKEQKYKDAIRLVTNLVPSPCSAKAKIIQKELIKQYSESECESKIHNAQIMVNTGILFQMKRAIPILLSISPQAPCASEAIALAKKIGDKMSNKPSDSVDIIRYQSGDSELWQKLFLLNLMKE